MRCSEAAKDLETHIIMRGMSARKFSSFHSSTRSRKFFLHRCTPIQVKLSSSENTVGTVFEQNFTSTELQNVKCYEISEPQYCSIFID